MTSLKQKSLKMRNSQSSPDWEGHEDQMGEWPTIDKPFTDDEPLTCAIGHVEICESCQ